MLRVHSYDSTISERRQYCFFIRAPYGMQERFARLMDACRRSNVDVQITSLLVCLSTVDFFRSTPQCVFCLYAVLFRSRTASECKGWIQLPVTRHRVRCTPCRLHRASLGVQTDSVLVRTAISVSCARQMSETLCGLRGIATFFSWVRWYQFD